MNNVFWSNIFRKPGDELDRITKLWQQTPLFQGIPDRHTRFLCGKMHVREFGDNEAIFSRGDQAAGAILVLQGQVRISTDMVELASLESGDFFGEIALAAPETRIADATAITASRLVYFLKQDLEEWIESEPRLGAHFLMNLASTLARRLLEANRQIAAQPQA